MWKEQKQRAQGIRNTATGDAGQHCHPHRAHSSLKRTDTNNTHACTYTHTLTKPGDSGAEGEMRGELERN